MKIPALLAALIANATAVVVSVAPDIKPRQPDFSYVDHGSIILLRPLTRAAWNWIGDRVPDYALFGGAIPVERRLFPDILDGIDADGLTFVD